MREYIHQLAQWPEVQWNYDAFADKLAQVRHNQGRLLGRMESFGFHFQQESLLVIGHLIVRQTAIGDAVGLAVKRLQDRPQDHRVLILLTDGRANVALGEGDPWQEALQIAGALRCHSLVVDTGASNHLPQRTSELADALKAPLVTLGDLEGMEELTIR